MEEEVRQLIERLKMLKNVKKEVVNNADIWRCIRAKDWAGAGFKDEQEAKDWISLNPYENL